MDPKQPKKLDEILAEIADKDAEIKKLQAATKITLADLDDEIKKLTTKIYDELSPKDAKIKELTEVIESSDKLKDGADNKLSIAKRAANLTELNLTNKEKAKILDGKQVKDLELKIAARAKILDDKTEEARILRNERAELDNQYVAKNGTRFEYSNNIDEKKSRVSVSLYGIIQEDGRIIADDRIAISKEVKYKKGVTDTTSLTYIKEDLKRQLIVDNIDLIRSRYNVWIDPKAVTERTNISNLPQFEVSDVIQEAAADKKAGNAQNKISPSKLTDAESAAIAEQFIDKKNPNGSASYVKSGTSDLKQIIKSSKDQLNPTDSKYEDLKNNSFNSTGIPIQPTGSTVITNNNNLNTINQENTNLNSETPVATLLSTMRKATIASQIRSKANYEIQISNNKLTKSDKVTVLKNIKTKETEIAEGIRLYNLTNPNDIIESPEQLMASSPQPAVVANNTGPAVVIGANNNNNNTPGSYVETGAANINPITDSIKDQLNLNGDKSPYLERNSASLEESKAAGLSPTSVSTAEYNNTNADNTDISTTQTSNDLGLNLTSMYNENNNTGDNNFVKNTVDQKPAITVGTSKQILKDNFAGVPDIIQKVGGKTNNILNEINQKTNINQSAASPYSVSDTNPGQTQNITNNMQQLTGMPPQSAEATQRDTPGPVDSSQYFVLMINALHALNDAVQTGIKVRGIPA